MNTLVGCQRRDGGDPADVVLVRVYGRGTSQLIDREQEINNMLVLNAVGLAAPVYCRFDNGIAYGYRPGVVLDVVSVRQPEMQK
jgi:ethanolamine kinase